MNNSRVRITMLVTGMISSGPSSSVPGSTPITAGISAAIITGMT